MALVGSGGTACLVFWIHRAEWDAATLGEVGLFSALIAVVGSFPLTIAPRVKADVTTALLFAAALLLEPGPAALTAVLGILTYTISMRFFGDGLRLEWYKYIFNGAETALSTCLTSLLFHELASSGPTSPAVVVAAGSMYMANSAMISCAASIQLGMSPLRFWWAGTKRNGLAQLSLLAFGFLGAVVYQETPWAVAALVVPVIIIYIAFSHLARNIIELERAREALQKSNEELELKVLERTALLETRVLERTAELTQTTEQLRQSRRRVVHAQEDLRKEVARLLHGPVQNRLLVATSWLRTARDALGINPKSSSENIDNATRLIDEINSADLRSAVRRLHPALIMVSLQASVKSLADEFQGSFQVELHFEHGHKATEDLWQTGLKEELRLAIFRVAEETLTNVLKHSAASRVDLSLEHPRGDLVTLTIRDNGRGFDVNKTVRGFGVLSMEDYCGAVGGSLEVESKVNDGTMIAASFPISMSLADRPSAAERVLDGVPPAPSNGNGHSELSANGEVTTLVVVDDQPDFCALVRELLAPYRQFQVLAEAHDGLSPLRQVEQLRPDVVMLDVEMPGLHGLETANEIQNRFPEVKIVMMSAYHQLEYIENTQLSGHWEFIPKVELSVRRLQQACRELERLA